MTITDRQLDPYIGGDMRDRASRRDLSEFYTDATEHAKRINAASAEKIGKEAVPSTVKIGGRHAAPIDRTVYVKEQAALERAKADGSLKAYLESRDQQ